MRAQIRPNRISISDRYPMLGFTIRTDGEPQFAEVTVATDTELFSDPSKRTSANFFSTWTQGPLPISGGEAVYILPPEILSRFIGKERLYFALATTPTADGNAYTVQMRPDADSIYVSLAGLTGRSLRRVRMFPNRGAARSPEGYGQEARTPLRWAGDTVEPGMADVSRKDQAIGSRKQPLRINGNGVRDSGTNGRAANGRNTEMAERSDGASRSANGIPQAPAMTPDGAGIVPPVNGEASTPEPVPYNDGFGDLPDLPDDQTETAAEAERMEDAAADDVSEEDMQADDGGDNEDTDTVAIAAALGAEEADGGPVLRNIGIGEQQPASAPTTHVLGSAARAALDAFAATNPPVAALLSAARAATERGLSVGIGPAISGGFVGGASLGAGVIIAPNDQVGAYGTAELQLGAIFSASVTLQVTVLRGGIEAFGGISYAAGVSGGEGIVVGGSAIFDADKAFLGVSLQAGLGAGLSPLDAYASVQRGVAQQLGYAAAFGIDTVTAEALGRSSAADARRHVPSWRDLLRWRAPRSVVSAIRARSMSVQTFASARGDLNIDRYEVRVDRLPRGQTAEQLIRHIRRNIARFVDSRNTEFNPYSPADRTKWLGSSPLGAVFNLDIFGPDNAAVVASMVERRRWRFTTLTASATGSHPVSGHREFGIRSTDDRGHIIYTRGADRFSYGVPSGGVLDAGAFAGGDHLWRSFQRKVAEYVRANGGSARILSPFQKQFQWSHASAALARSGRGSSSSRRRSSSSQALGADTNPHSVEIKYRMFIPSPAISGPFSSDYGGDGRGFSYDGGTSRGEIIADVTLTRDMGIDGVTIRDRHWGESTAYGSSDTVPVAGKPDWWLDLRQGAVPTERAALEATDDNLRAFPGTSGRFAVEAFLENASAITIHASGALPLSRVAPDIDADVSVFFRLHNGKIQAKAVGRHDGFPSHELYVNRRSVYRFDPAAVGTGPTSLAGWGDRDVDTEWVTVARPGAGTSAQALAFQESFTLNWDEVQQIAQPTRVSCWAAAAAMVVGWRDRISLTPDAIADITERPVKQGLNPADVGHLAQALDLVAEPPQSYSQEGFRQLLEANGPLWVAAAAPGLHAIVVTGLYNEGGQLYVRITDPWDRAVGSPGQPGAYARMHATGSRYIMMWRDFVAEYEEAATDFSGVNLQILHAGGNQGRRPNSGSETPPGYAAALERASPAATPSAPVPTATNGVATTSTPSPIEAVPTPKLGQAPAPTPPQITLADNTEPVAAAIVTPVNEPHGGSSSDRWTALIAASFGEDVADKLGGLPAMAAERRWTIAAGLDAAEGYAAGGVGIGPNGTVFRYGLVPASTAQTAAAQTRLLFTLGEGGPELLTQWTKARAFSTNGGVTGAILLDATDMPLAMAVRLAPSTDIVAQLAVLAQSITQAYQTATIAAPTVQAPVTPPQPEARPAPQPADPTSEMVQPAPPAATAAAFSMMHTTPMPSPDIQVPQQNGATSPAGADDFPSPGVTIHRSEVERGGVAYELFLMDGSVSPEESPVADPSLMPGEQIVVDDWPYLDGPNGRAKGGAVIDWSYGAGAVGNVRVAPAAPSAPDGRSVKVQASIQPGPSTPDEVKLLVTLRTTFSMTGEADRIGVTRVTLCGSGKHQIEHYQEASPQQETRQADLVPA